MATTTIPVDSTTYVLITTNDALVQNTSIYGCYVVFDVSLPAVDTTHRHLLSSGQAITKSSGSPAGNIYARAVDNNRIVYVAVSE